MHQKAGKFVFVSLKAKEDAETDIVDAALHGAVVGLGVVGVVMLGTGGVQLFVALLVVGLLEEDVGANAGFLELAVVLHRRRGDVDVDAADVAVLVVDAVNCVDALQNVLDRVVLGILAGLDCETLVSHILQRDDLGADLLLGQLLARDMLVLEMIRAVKTSVDAVVGQIQRRKEHDAVAVEGQLDLLGDLKHLLDLLRDLAGEQDGGLAVGQAGAGAAVGRLAGAGLLEDLVDQLDIVLVLLSVSDRSEDLLVVDKLLSLE